MKKEIVLKLSDIYEETGFGNSEDAECIDLHSLEETTFFCADTAADHIRAAIRDVSVKGMHWIDSGDYHYISLFFLEKIREPFCLVMIDHHCDMQESAFGGGILSCGSWVKRSLETLPLLKRVILVGPDDDEILDVETKSFQDRLLWIKEEQLRRDLRKISVYTNDLPVYISLDKDVLSKDCYRTGWTQGSLSVKEVSDILEDLYHNTDVLGIDLCGEAAKNEGSFDSEDLRINEETNSCLRSRIKHLEREER